ncbi:DUF3325 domain-containing protein [Bordetella sp. BOR01]|uniref:DUF3325 domain-containing protein n=1 Tax=Bordetella sp. BOR01 TaxID=2854779 RepID=UPI001C43F6B9|nr:DUF3325 domain-containing protein [Bordetella sp. BOR01]MBV7486277.1 DUF3325 domain-containing protein [Bordetella sp. BOR01]
MNHLAVQLLSLLAFGALALAMERHQEDFFERPLSPTTTRWLRLTGWLALVLALLAAILGQGWALGLVSYSGHTSLAAGLVFATLLVWQRRKTRR